MGTPCRCCGKKTACESQEIRFDHDRYKHFAKRGFISIKQEIFRKVNDSNFTKLSEENFEFSDEESYACNLVLEKEESKDAFINGQTVVETIKTVSTVIRKFILVYQIDDVFDWEDKNIRGESLINNIRIRTGHIISGEASIKANPPSPIAIPGACERDADSQGIFGPNFGNAGEYCVKKDIQIPSSLREFDNLFSDGTLFKTDDRITNTRDGTHEIGLLIPEDIAKNLINENNIYYVLVQCPFESSIPFPIDRYSGNFVEFGKWGNPQDGGCGEIEKPVVSNTTFLELQRITSLQEPVEKKRYFDPSCYDNYMQFHGIQQVDKYKEEERTKALLNDIADWHDYFVRTANGEYYSKNSYMDIDLDLSNFILGDPTLGDYLYFQYCGTLELLIRNLNTEETYFNAYYDMVHREVKGLVDLSSEFSCCTGRDPSKFLHFEKGSRLEDDIFKLKYKEICEGDGIRSGPESEVKELSIKRKELEDIASMKKYPDTFYPSNDPTISNSLVELELSPYVFEFTPDHNKFIQTFRYRVGERTMPDGDLDGSGPDRFEGRAYIINELRTHYDECTKVSCLDTNYRAIECEIKQDDIEEKPCCVTSNSAKYSGARIFDKCLNLLMPPDRYGNINEETKCFYGGVTKMVSPENPFEPFYNSNNTGIVGGINNVYIRKCVIESTNAQVVSGMESTFKDQSASQGNPKGRDKANLPFEESSEHFLNVPHYGEYQPSQIVFKLSNKEDENGASVFDSAEDENLHGASRINFYPYKMLISDINASCPNECTPNQHGLEWRVLKSSFGAAGEGSKMQKSILYGVEGDCVTELNHPREFKAGGTADYVDQFSTVLGKYKPSAISVFAPDNLDNLYYAYPSCSNDVIHKFPDHLSLGGPFRGLGLFSTGNGFRNKGDGFLSSIGDTTGKYAMGVGSSYVCGSFGNQTYGRGNFAQLPPYKFCTEEVFGTIYRNNTIIKGTTGFSRILIDGCDKSSLNPQDPPDLI